MSSKESDRKESSPKLLDLSKDLSEGVYVGGAFAVVGVGFLGAVQYSMRKDRELFKKNKVPTMYAAKAFLYGTLLCVGTFASVGALGVFVTGISNAKDFGRSMRKLFGSKTPESEFETDGEMEFDNLKQDLVEFFIENDETNQARDLLIEKPKVEIEEEPEAEKAPRESPIMSLFKDKNGEYSKKSPILAWLKEQRAKLMGEPSPTKESKEVKVDSAVVKEIVETALKSADSEPASNTSTETQSTLQTVEPVLQTKSAETRTWMQFWSETVYGTTTSSSSTSSGNSGTK